MLKNIYQFSKEELIGLLKESFPMNLYLYMEEMILFIAAQNTMVDPNMQYNMIYTDSLFSLSYVPSFYLRICLKAFFSKSSLLKKHFDSGFKPRKFFRAIQWTFAA